MSTADTLLAQLAQLDNAQDVVKWAKKRTRQIAQLNGESGAIWEALKAKGVAAAALVDIQEAVAVKSSTMHVSKRIGDDLAKWGYHFWLNDMDDSIWNGDQRWTDSDNAVLRMTARDAGYAELRLLTALEDATTAIAAGRRRHPVREYLTGLQWDGKDHVAHLASYFTDKHDPIIYQDGTRRTAFHAFLLRWLVGAVAKMHGDENAARNNFVLVLAANQGSGKSHFASWMCPLPGYFIEKHVNPDDKDCSLYRTRAFVWEIMEIGATTKRADVESLKAHITATTVVERKAYGHYDTHKPAVASYIGTVNPDGAGFLQDTTGNRRFAVVDIDAIDWRYADAVNADQVWAQAVALWRKDRTAYRFTAEEVKAQADNAEAHMDPDIMADMLARVYDIDRTKAGTVGWSATSSEILEALRTYAGLSRGHDKVQGRELARTLKRQWGITSRRSGGATVYDGLVRKDVDHG